MPCILKANKRGHKRGQKVALKENIYYKFLNLCSITDKYPTHGIKHLQSTV